MWPAIAGPSPRAGPSRSACCARNKGIAVMLLKDRVAVVTGPPKGMGAACTKLLAEHGADLPLVGRDTTAIEGGQAEGRARGGRPGVVLCDRRGLAAVA